ncbi:fatty acid hydroxylase domain-containing protein 2-like [Cloeon dipterum]|uniref:fatty acid hydroxylase domain-containing protein 2-like n=1 Tax=Cloeon dipterum TaxID=197152 RepID=UPI00321FD8C4
MVGHKQQRDTGRLASSLGSALVLLASIVVVFAAFRNSLTWHLQRFWGASGDFWQSNWEWALDSYGQDEEKFYVFGLTLLTMTVFWGIGSIYIFMDLTNWPKFMRKYKIQPGTNEPLDKSKLIQGALQGVFNQIVVGLPVAMLAYKLMQWRGMPPTRELPTFQRVLFELPIFILIEEFGFYYSHRLLHHKSIYKYIHKKHHEWTAPVSVMAIYCHPVEHFFSNMFPILLGPFLLGSHMATGILWFILAIITTLNDHSGYHMPFAFSSEFHDFHHLKFNQCFGVLGLLDRLHGTDAVFRKNMAFKRHMVVTSFKSARELYPDELKKSK